MILPRAQAAPVFFVCLALLLSGCAGKNTTNPAQKTSDAPPEEIRTLLEGRVQGTDFQAVPGANVGIALLKLNATTNATGMYRFYNLAPGDYVLTASKDGYRTKFERASIVDGVSTVLNITIEEAPVAKPFHETATFTGQVSCQFITTSDASNTVEDCGALDPNNKPSHVFEIGRDAAEVQIEAFWNPATSAARHLTIRVEGRDAAAGPPFTEFDGPSGMKAVLTNALVHKYFTQGGSILVTMGAGPSVTQGGPIPQPDFGVAVAQQFEVYCTVFYHEPGPETFSIKEQ